MSEDKRDNAWLDTFQFEEDEGDHRLGAHWSPFFADTSEFLQRLPEVLPATVPIQGYGDFFPPPRQLPAGWPAVFYLAWPNVHQGALLAIRRNGESGSELVSLFPHCRSGVEHTLNLECVTVWKGGCEAQIEGTLGDACITFFDTLYGVNRGWYEAGKEYQFILTGLAFEARAARDVEFDMPGPDLSEILWGMLQESDMTRGNGPMKVSTRYMTALIPIQNGDADDYQFHGPVKSVKQFEMLDQPAWLVRATLMRGIQDEREYDFDVVITHKAWEGEEPPKVGEDIEGVLWLQGYLWLPQR